MCPESRQEVPTRLRTAVFIPFEKDIAKFIWSLTSHYTLDYRVHPAKEPLSDVTAVPPDVIFVGPDGNRGNGAGGSVCRELRQAGYQGVVLLVIEGRDFSTSTSDVTSKGFDNYILTSGGVELWEDSIHMGVLNRRRKNKYIVQFDESPDCFCIIDSSGRVHEINLTAAEGSGHTPKEIVTRGIPYSAIPSLKTCALHAIPLVTRENIGRIFDRTVVDDRSVYQLKIKIHDIPTIGVVGTLLKSDITKTIYARTLDILVNSVLMLSERDQYTAGHSARVLHYCTNIARVMGRDGSTRFKSQLTHAALLHDIGKIGIRDSILLKPGKLTSEEFHSLSTHSVKGYKLVSHFEFLKDSMDLIRYHHERPDGKGYPDKLVGNKIPLGASIIAVADSFDAMTTNRPYRESLGYEKAIEEIRIYRGTQYNGEVADAFLSFITPAIHAATRDLSRRPLTEIAQGVIENI